MKAAKALKEKGETPEELLRSIKENEAAAAEAQRTVDAWKAIVGEKSRREEAAKAEAERKAAEERERAEAEEEARVEAERKAEEERKTKEEERKERDENGQPFVVSSDGTTTFGEITEDTGLTAAPIKLSEGFQDANTGKGYGLVHIEANHGEQIRQAGFTSVKEFVSFVATHYDPDNIRVGKRRDDGSDTFLIQVTDTHDNTLFIELSKDGSYWNVNSGGIFRKGYSNKKETVAKTEPQQPTNAVSSDSSLSANVKDGITNAEPNGEPTVSLDKGTTLPADQQTSDKENTKKVADSEGENTLKAKIEAASADVNTEPTEAQKKAGNYKKGHVQVGTFDITIEQPEGSIRRGTDANGKQWESKMHNTYGYFRGTEGVDGDHIDVFLSNDIDGWNGRKVFVVDQYNPDGTFDEHKVMLGFNDMDEAKSDYLANYEKGWENGRRIDVSATNLEDFEKWIDSSHRKTKPFSEYSSVNKETVATDKGGEKAEKKQKKQSVFDKAKEIADKEEKKRKAEAEDDSVLGQATRAVGKKKKVNLFKYTASKIISYPALRGVHYANGYAYASDGYILFKEKADYPKEWEGTTRDKDGNLIDGKYPDAEKAMRRPVHIPDKEAVSLPSKEVLDFAIAASKKLKGEAIPVAIDGLFFNAVNLKKFLEAVASKGMDKIVYRHPMLYATNGKDEIVYRHPMLYATNGKDEIVLMPTVNTLEGALDIADRMERAGLPKEQIDAWKAHIEAADKKMSLEDFKKAVENAKKEGVRHTEAEKPKEQPLTEAERKDAEEVAGALGYRVEWVDTMEENGTIDADKKVIRIAKDAENPLVQVLGHEVAHGVRRMIGGKFRALQKAAMEVVGEKEWNERIEKKRKLNAYAEGKLAEEVTCDIVGEALNDKDALKRLAESLRGERGILARLRDAVVRMVEYFKNRGDKEGVRRMKAADKLLAEFESALKEGVAPEQVKPEDVDRSVRESGDEPENKRRKDFAERFGVDESYVSDYANGMAQKKTGKAARARRSMERQIYLANAGKTSKLSDIAKSLKPFRAALKEAFGDLDALIDEYRKLFEEERNMMEAARKKAEEEAAARKRHLDELSLLTEGQIDSRYAEALEKGDETEAREMLDEVARRKGYGDENNEYRMQHRAPSNPGYESDEARRNDIENGPDVNLEDIALGYNSQPDDYFTNPRGYGNDTPHGRESTDAVANALSSIRQGGRDVTVKVYRAVPTTMKEGKLRNGDWVTLSRRYAEMHGNHALNGKYRIMEDEVPAKDIWWDGNDVNEFGYDNGEDYKYKNVKNNRKSDDLVTRDDKGNVIPPSKRFNQRKADERYSRRESKALTAEERELRDNLVERMRKGGLDVVTDSEEMQRVIDTENERTRESRKRRSAVAEERLRVGNTIDEAMAAATHLTKEEARAMRREWERKFKEETKELYGRVLSGNFDDVTLQLIDEFIDKSTPNNPYERPISKRLPTRALQKMRGGERTGSVDALFSRICESTVGKDGKTLPRAERERAIEEKKKELLKKWAIATGNWHTDIADFTDQREPIGSGTDSDVYLGKDGKSVIKVSKGKPYGKRFRPDVDNVALFNSVFRNSAYTIVGYGEVDGKFVRFLKQPIVDFTSSTPLTEGERVAYMEKLGFKPINKENTAFSNGEIIASDLQKSNIVKDKQGNVRVIDADMKLHTKDFGGKFSYPDAETDTRTDGVQRFLRTADGEVYGLVKDGRIYLDPKVATSETAVHEYTHLWGDMLRRKDSEQWSHTVKELKNSVLWEEVKELYPELKTDDEIADEVLSTFSGRRGAERLREEARRVADGEGGVFTKAKAIETLERVKEAIARFWEGVARMFGINRYRSAEELADMAMRDLLDSKNPMKDESGMRKRGEVGETLATSGTYFSGGGLLEAGLKGVIDPKVAVEFSEKIAGVYADNHGNHIVVADVRDVDPKKLVGAVDGGEVQYFHASPVCKNFSKAKREGGEVELDKETALSTAEFIAKTRPKVVTIENVKGYRNSEALKIITDELTRQGYDWDADVYNAADYGGYTKRERLIVRAKRDGKLPPKPEKLPEELRKKGWYSAVEDLIPHLEEKKTGVPQGTDERLKNSGIDYRTIDKPLYVFGRGYANKTVGHAFADELLPTLTTGGGDIIIMPDGRVLKASPRVLARVTGLPDTYKMPETDQLSHTIVGNGIPTQLTEGVIAPLLDNAIPSAERATKRESVFDMADRVSQNLEERMRAMAVKKVNDRFNEELELQVKGELEEGHVYKLGMPSEILLSTGVPNLPIQMSAQRLEDKATKFGHNFDIAEVKDLVNAIQKPIAIFEYGDRNKSQNLIVEIQKDGKNFIIGLSLNPVVKGKALEINSVRNVFPKDNAEWLNWISQNKLLYADKEKIQALIDKQQTNLADVNYLNLDDVAKKVKDFENPKLFDGKISEVDKKGSDSTDRSVRENPKNEDKPRFSRKPGESIFDYASRVSEDVDRSVRERVSARDEYEKKVKSKGFQTKEALQNSMLGLQEFMYAIDHASGNKRYIEDIPDFENPILGENRLSSVNKEEMHQVAKTQFKPLMSAVAKLSGNGKESGELYDYMFAKHGLERDAVMRQREAQKEFDKYQKANPKGTKTIGDFVASLEGKDYAGLTALTAEDGRVKSIQSQIDAIDEQMKATDDQLLLRKLGGQKKRLKVDLLNAARDAADDIRKTFENNPSHDRSDINELWSRVNEVNGNTLRKLYESGMLTKEAYNEISSMYTNYIPMRGFDQTTSADAYAYLTHGDSAFNAPIKTAKGRSSKADNPIAYMQAMAESAIMQGNRNVLVKQKMLNFVRNHPSDLASVSDVWLQYDSVADEWKPVFPDNIGANDSASVVAKKMEAFEDKMKQMAEKHPDLVQRSNEAPDIPYKVVEKGQLNEHQVLVKQNGKSYIITVNGSPRAAQAANGLTNPDTDLTGAVGKVFEGAEALNRQLSSLYTTLNPDFIGSNYVRDALYSNTMVYVKEGAKYGGSFNLNFAKYNPAEMANLYARYNKGSLDTSNETHRLFLEFMQNGGETGFVNLKQIEKRKSEIAKAIKRDGRISAAQIWGGLGDAVDFANRAVENSARFAAYVTSRKSGRSVGRSVYDAKEISVNFNRKGSGRNWWKDNVGTSRFYDTEIGLVEINRASVGSSLAHRYSQVKLDVITSLAEGFNNAVYFGSMQDFSRQEGVKSHYFAYPINYNGNRNYVFCRAMQDANKSRLYVHEVFLADNIEKGNTLQTAASQPHGGITLYKDILANVLAANVTNDSETSKPCFSRKPGESIFGYASRVSEDVDRSVCEGR